MHEPLSSGLLLVKSMETRVVPPAMLKSSPPGKVPSAVLPPASMAPTPVVQLLVSSGTSRRLEPWVETLKAWMHAYPLEAWHCRWRKECRVAGGSCQLVAEGVPKGEPGGRPVGQPAPISSELAALARRGPPRGAAPGALAAGTGAPGTNSMENGPRDGGDQAFHC